MTNGTWKRIEDALRLPLSNGVKIEREPKNFDPKPLQVVVEGTEQVIDYADPISTLNTKLRELNDSIPAGQARRTAAAFTEFVKAAQALGEYLNQVLPVQRE